MGPLQFIAVAAHLLQPLVRRLEYFIEERPQDIPFKIDSRRLTADEIIERPDGLIAFAQFRLFFMPGTDLAGTVHELAEFCCQSCLLPR